MFRFDASLKRSMEQRLTDLRWREGWTPLASWLTNLLLQVEDDPSSWPFCLSEREFEHYARVTFGNTVQASEGIYHPPSFYSALGQDVAAYGMLAVVGAVVTASLPEDAIASVGALTISPGMASAAATAVAAGALNHIMPGGAWDAATKDRLWPRYETDLQRRRLQ